jgi:lipopolysaccharide export LptBFGC system permease protein LptF
MENALYYTLSTIAQTLAGALAILVAVVLFKLAMLRQIIAQSTGTFDVRSIDMWQGWPILRDQGPQAFLAHLEQVQHFSGVGPNSDVGRNAEAAHGAHQDWGRINGRLYVTLSASVFTIALCFIALPFTPRLAASQSVLCFVAIAVGLRVVCLLLYVWLIVAMVRRPSE